MLGPLLTLQLAESAGPRSRLPDVSFICGDFLNFEACFDWSDADVLFMNSTCFDDAVGQWRRTALQSVARAD